MQPRATLGVPICFSEPLLTLDYSIHPNRKKEKGKKKELEGLEKLVNCKEFLILQEGFFLESNRWGRQGKHRSRKLQYEWGKKGKGTGMANQYCSARNICFHRVDCFYSDVGQNRSRQEQHHRIWVFCFLHYFNTSGFDQNCPAGSQKLFPKKAQLEL